MSKDARLASSRIARCEGEVAPPHQPKPFYVEIPGA